MVRRATFAVVALATGLLVGVFMAEGGLRLAGMWIGRHSDTMFTIIEHDSIFGWRMKPNVNETIDLVDVEGVPVRSNSLGFWDKEFDLKKPSDRCRIVFLGDSFAWGFGVREGERFANLVASANPRWESLNFAVPGYGTDQSLLLWQHITRHYRPDLVVLTIYQNDYVDNMSTVRYGREKPYFRLKDGKKLELKNVPVRATDFWDNGIYHQAAPEYASFFRMPIQKRSRTLHWLAKHSDLARFGYTVLRRNDLGLEVWEKARKLYERRPVRAYSSDTDNSDTHLVIQTQVRLLGGLVRELAEEVEETGARFAVVLSGDSVPHYELQKKAFREDGILFFEATTDILAALVPEGGQHLYYPYSKHWTPVAHRAVAELIGKNISAKGLCPVGS